MADNQQYYGSPIAPPPSMGGRQSIGSISEGGGTPWRLLIGSVVLFVLVLVIYAGMAFGYEPYLRGQVARQDAQMKQIESEVNQGNQSANLVLFSQLYNINQLGKNHVMATNLFSEIEKNTSPLVRITSAQFNITSNMLMIAGVVPSSQVMIQQSSAWEQDPAVASFMLNSFKPAGPSTGGVFTATITFVAGTFLQH